MTDDTILPFSFPAVHTKKVTAAFDGGRLTSNGGVMLLAMAERRLGLADKLARVFPDRRDPTRVVHSLVDMFRARMFAICCGYEDADDLDHLRSDPAFKLACGRLPDTGRDLCSQPTLSRLENAPRLRDVIRLTYTLVDAWMDIDRDHIDEAILALLFLGRHRFGSTTTSTRSAPSTVQSKSTPMPTGSQSYAYSSYPCHYHVKSFDYFDLIWKSN
jgi:hypothetical protein